MKKHFKIIIVTIIVVIAFLTIYKAIFSNRENFSPLNMVPENALVVIEMDNPYQTWNELGESAIWKHLTNNPFIGSINQEIDGIDSLLNANKLMFKLFGKRKIMTSVHYTSQNKYAALIVVNMQDLSKLKTLQNQLRKLNTQYYSITTRNYHEYEIFEVYDKENREMIYLSFFSNLLVLSYDHLLLEHSLDQSKLPILSRNYNFINVTNLVKNDGQIRFYINFDALSNLKQTESTNGPIYQAMRSLYFGAVKLEIYENNLDLEGYINGTDSIPSFLNLISGNKKGGNDIFNALPERTFLLAHFSNRSFLSVLGHLEENLKSQDLYDDYNKQIKKIEQLIEIDVDKNIYSWIGDEIGLVNLQSKYNGQPAEQVLVLKCNNQKNAIKNLEFISAQMKTYLPIRFRPISYKNITINYLSASGLFRLILGNYFSRLEKPYYMVYNNFVYISNHPQTLKDIIDDIENKITLSNNIDFYEFRRKFNPYSNIFIYINPPIFNKYYSSTLIGNMEDNGNFFDKLSFLGVQINKENSTFFTHVSLNYQEEDSINFNMFKQDKNTIYKIFPAVIQPDINSDTFSGLNEKDSAFVPLENPFTIPNFAILELGKEIHEEFYSDSKLKFSVEVNKGIKNGDFTWFYPNGQIMVKGKYKNDAQTGTWRYFNPEGKTIEKRRF